MRALIAAALLFALFAGCVQQPWASQTAQEPSVQATAQPAQPSVSATPSPQATAQAGAQTAPPQSARPREPRGSPAAKVTITEYSDFQCPYCGRVEPTMVRILQDYAGLVKLEFRHFPLAGHAYAQKASEAAECAGDQGRFWEMHDKLFANQGALAEADLGRYAAELGLNASAFSACLGSGAKAAVVKADFLAGIGAGVSATPAFFVNGRLVLGAQPYEVFKQAVDEALAAETT